MGVFDTYVDPETTDMVQIKVNNDFDTYNVGDQCPLEDGAYVGHEGVVVVRAGRVVAVTERVWDKWGNRLKPSEVIRPNDPIAAVIDEFPA